MTWHNRAVWKFQIARGGAWNNKIVLFWNCERPAAESGPMCQSDIPKRYTSIHPIRTHSTYPNCRRSRICLLFIRSPVWLNNKYRKMIIFLNVKGELTKWTKHPPRFLRSSGIQQTKLMPWSTTLLNCMVLNIVRSNQNKWLSELRH